jgi:BlaI family transcriptional regulator, penicillinase repressor
MKYQKLTKAEEEIMQLIWNETEPVVVSQLIEKMEEPYPPHSTISSIVRILETKGFVDHKTYGRTHAYFAIVDKKDYSKYSLKNLVGNYFEGSVNELVSFLVKENDLSLKDLSEIIDKLENEE